MKKFVKTLAVLVAAAATVAAMSASVSAVAVSSIEQKAAPAVVSDGGVSDLTVTPAASATSTEFQTALAEVKAATSVSTLNSNVSTLASNAGVSASNLVVKDIFDITGTISGSSVTVSLQANLPANAFYVVLHYVNSAWEVVGSGVSTDGTVSFTTSSFSPFAIVTTGDATVTSPQTDNGVNVAVYAAVLLAASAVVVACKKTAR